MNTETFTAYRFENTPPSDCAMTFIALSDNGFTPQWATEAECKSNPKAKRALLIQLPKSEAAKFREYQNS